MLSSRTSALVLWDMQGDPHQEKLYNMHNRIFSLGRIPAKKNKRILDFIFRIPVTMAFSDVLGSIYPARIWEPVEWHTPGGKSKWSAMDYSTL